ncbi:MAG TPA: hypothetical protein VIL78_17120 [Hanamia sp.]|jgi:hypothetical protein
MKTANGRGPPQNPQRSGQTAPPDTPAQLGNYSFYYKKHLKIKIMKTEVKDSKTAKSNGSLNGVNSVTADNKAKQFVHGNPLNPVSVKKEIEPEQPKEEIKAGEAEKPTPQAEQVKAEAPKAEVKTEPKAEVKAEPAKTLLNLEGTLKLVEELHRRKVQRDKLMETIQNLEAFEVNQKDEAEESGITNYSRCELTIADDKGKSFTTKNPVIIFHVTQYVNALCIDKLAQIEAGIMIPA